MRTTALIALAGILFFSPAPLVAQGQDSEAIIERHCAEEWSSDNRMRTYCEKQQRSAVRELAQLNESKGGLPEADFNPLLGKCWQEWEGDYRMTAHCLKKQIKSYGEVAGGPSAYGFEPTAQEKETIEQSCSGEWSGDYRMQSYCQEQQMEGLGYVRSDPPQGVSGTAWRNSIGHCEREWPGDYRMQAYCVKQSFE